MIVLPSTSTGVTILIVGVLFSLIGVSKQDCIWYGVCNKDAIGHKQYCSYNGTAKAMNDEGLQLLAERCSFLLESEQKNFCCDVEQVKILNEQVKLAANILDRCPACMTNLVRHICEFSCSPLQSEFAKVVETEKNKDDVPYITSIDLHITEEYINKTYKSCSQVSVPQTGQLAFDLMCGAYPASRCSPTKWFTYMGDKQNPYVPFQITYVQHPTNSTKDGFTPANPKTTPCNKAVNSELPACSCTDCELSCPIAPDDPVIPPSFKIGGFDAFTVIMTVVFSVGTVIFLMGSFLFTKDSINDEEFQVGNDGVTDDSMYKPEPRYFEKLGARTEFFLENIFTRWGTFFASYPWMTLLGGIVIVVVFGYGITFVQITTDPVKLWASPTSKSRIEREYFDSKFEPFFRIEQIIIKAVDLPYINHNTSNGPIKFGPIFKKDFLANVLDLQESIKNLDANGTSLNHICYAPLKDDDSTVQASDCVVQSIWGYFQDDEERLEDNEEDNGYNVTYLDELYQCMKVIPFLVLAVGVDNIFILVQTYQRDQRRTDETIEQQVGRVLGRVGPSMLLTSVSECCCFFLGGLSDMPAVKAFALYAGVALLIDFMLQITCFVGLFTLDIKRKEENRLDICCFIKCKKSDSVHNTEGLLYKFISGAFVPLLMKKVVRAFVMIIFFAWFCASIALVPKIDIGLDQELAMPEDSFVLHYIKSLNEHLSIGPPVYFVLKGDINYSNTSSQNLVCSGRYCNDDSALTQLYLASRRPNLTYIARPASSWIDDYFDWTVSPSCCKYHPNNGSFCPHEDTSCLSCNITKNQLKRPDVHDFGKYLPFFLKDNPDDSCVKAGHAAYSGGVRYNFDKKSLNVDASYFMAYHSILKTSADYFLALESARKISTNITQMLQRNLITNGLPMDLALEVELYWCTAK
ncbi:hypothetical protein ACLKA7_002475 [Drosophila subpalustris]